MSNLPPTMAFGLNIPAELGEMPEAQVLIERLREVRTETGELRKREQTLRKTEIPRTRSADIGAEGAAIAAGKKSPAPKAEALAAEHVAIKSHRLPALAAAEVTILHELVALVDERRPELGALVAAAIDNAATEVHAAVEDLTIAMRKMGRAERAGRWLDRFPRDSGSTAGLRGVADDYHGTAQDSERLFELLHGWADERPAPRPAQLGPRR